MVVFRRSVGGVRFLERSEDPLRHAAEDLKSASIADYRGGDSLEADHFTIDRS